LLFAFGPFLIKLAAEHSNPFSNTQYSGNQNKILKHNVNAVKILISLTLAPLTVP